MAADVDLMILPNGDLEMSITEANYAGIDWDLLLARGMDDALGDLLEHYQGNGWGLYCGSHMAMTDSPLITDSCTVLDDGTNVIYGPTWWFPNYAVENPVETLRDKRRVVFPRGAEPPKFYEWFWGQDPLPEEED